MEGEREGGKKGRKNRGREGRDSGSISFSSVFSFSSLIRASMRGPCWLASGGVLSKASEYSRLFSPLNFPDLTRKRKIC